MPLLKVNILFETIQCILPRFNINQWNRIDNWQLNQHISQSRQEKQWTVTYHIHIIMQKDAHQQILTTSASLLRSAGCYWWVGWEQPARQCGSISTQGRLQYVIYTICNDNDKESNDDDDDGNNENDEKSSHPRPAARYRISNRRGQLQASPSSQVLYSAPFWNLTSPPPRQ